MPKRRPARGWFGDDDHGEWFGPYWSAKTVGVERRGMGARLRADRLESPHGADVDHIDHAGIAHRDVAAREGVVEEDDVGRSRQRYRGQRLARGGLHGKELAIVGGTQEAPRVDVEIESVGADGRH